METTKRVAAPGTETEAAQGIASKMDVTEMAIWMKRAIFAAVDDLDKEGDRRDEWLKIECILAVLALQPDSDEVLGAISERTNHSYKLVRHTYAAVRDALDESREQSMSEGARDE